MADVFCGNASAMYPAVKMIRTIFDASIRLLSPCNDIHCSLAFQKSTHCHQYSHWFHPSQRTSVTLQCTLLTFSSLCMLLLPCHTSHAHLSPLIIDTVLYARISFFAVFLFSTAVIFLYTLVWFLMPFAASHTPHFARPSTELFAVITRLRSLHSWLKSSYQVLVSWSSNFVNRTHWKKLSTFREP